jgi:hypothetical protein
MTTITTYRVDTGFINRRSASEEVEWKTIGWRSDRVKAIQLGRREGESFRVVKVTTETAFMSSELQALLGLKIE